MNNIYNELINLFLITKFARLHLLNNITIYVLLSKKNCIRKINILIIDRNGKT